MLLLLFIFQYWCRSIQPKPKTQTQMKRNDTKRNIIIIQALELIPKWAPIDIADALELLSSSFLNPEVRKYAVDQLKRAEDDVC